MPADYSATLAAALGLATVFAAFGHSAEAARPARPRHATPAAPAAAMDPDAAILQTGTASWYGAAWQGRRTASGARFDQNALTAASHTLPLGTRVWVTLDGTARSVLVTINDHQGCATRVLDLSREAARRLGIIARGTGRVTLRRA